MPTVARIATERLLLREKRDGDPAVWAQFTSDPDFRRYVPVRRSDEAPERRAERGLDNLMARWQKEPLSGVGWVISRRADGQLIGIGGVDEGEVPEDGELDYFLGKPFWGQGYGREAAHAMARFAIDNRSFKRLVAYVVPANVGSVRIAESLGLRFEREVDYLQLFPDPSLIELADPITHLFAAKREDVRLGGGTYQILQGAEA